MLKIIILPFSFVKGILSTVHECARCTDPLGKIPAKAHCKLAYLVDLKKINVLKM